MKQNKCRLKVLILGGYGNFGKLISTALSQKEQLKNQNIQVVIAGRNSQKAQLLAQELQCDYLTIDVNKDPLTQILKAHQIDLIISTIGPFQGQSYHIAESAIAAKTHYIDLADSREFVTGISTLSAVLSYAGETFNTWKNRHWQSTYGLHNIEHRHFYHLPKKRWVSSCNVPDLEIFPENYPSLKNISFKAGVGISLIQFSASFIAFLRRFKLLSNPVKYAPFFYKIAQQFERFGDGLSGMQIRMLGKSARGDSSTNNLEINWEIIGYDNEGPNIPCYAAIILTRKLANNQLQERGAFPSTNLITLQEYLAELTTLNIKTFTDFNPPFHTQK